MVGSIGRFDHRSECLLMTGVRLNSNPVVRFELAGEGLPADPIQRHQITSPRLCGHCSNDLLQFLGWPKCDLSFAPDLDDFAGL
jgi:hypothetical protein